MACTKITIPQHLNIPNLIRWGNQLWRPSNEPEIRIDFCKTQFFTPFSMMFLINQIETYKQRFPYATIVVENYAHLSWPIRMGFFSTLEPKIIGGPNNAHCAKFAVKDGEEIPSTLPITTLLTRDFKDAHGVRRLEEMNVAIDDEAVRLARTLTQLGSGNTFDVVQYALREIIRNVFEHSGSDHVRYSAQYWAKTRIVEMTISDIGMGIHGSLTFNPSYANLGERDALHYACFPGVSGNAKAMKERASGSPWQNSGYGLYMTSRLCRNAGDFFIVSSNRALLLNHEKKTDFALPNFRGTLIRLHMNLVETENLRSTLARYREEGKRLAETIRGAKVIEASAASQMLRRDFEGQASGKRGGQGDGNLG